MSRKIKLTNEDIDSILNKFRESIENTRFNSEKITFTTETTIKEQKKIKVLFTPQAYCKMTTLIQSCEKEIAWHGTVEKIEEGYVITDILMYPQEITGATVTSNDEKYPVWLMQQPDEIFNKLRFQGHSHVNFGATPSATDLRLYDNMLQTLSEEDFYIFLIMNKKSDFWIQVYNLAENIVYEKSDIDVAIMLDNGKTGIEWFTDQCKDNIITKELTVPATKKVTGAKYNDPTWRWDFIRKCYVPTNATDKEIKNCFDKAKKKAKNKTSYDEIAKEELELLHDEVEQLNEELEELAMKKMLDDTKPMKINRVAEALTKEQENYWKKYYGGDFDD